MVCICSPKVGILAFQSLKVQTFKGGAAHLALYNLKDMPIVTFLTHR